MLPRIGSHRARTWKLGDGSCFSRCVPAIGTPAAPGLPPRQSTRRGTHGHHGVPFKSLRGRAAAEFAARTLLIAPRTILVAPRIIRDQLGAPHWQGQEGAIQRGRVCTAADDRPALNRPFPRGKQSIKSAGTLLGPGTWSLLPTPWDRALAVNGQHGAGALRLHGPPRCTTVGAQPPTPPPPCTCRCC